MDAGSIIGTGVGAVLSGIFGVINNSIAQQREQQARRENYLYNETAAQNADKRTRALYNDFYTPEALLRQYQKAGLSPSMMFGGTPGQGGMSGAQGAGVSQPSTFMPVSMMEGAQIANLAAQTAKTKAETQNILKDTDIKKLQEDLMNMQNGLFRSEFTLLNTGYQMPDGSTQSYYDIAGQFHSFDKFIEAAREAATAAGDQGMITALASEAGMRTMRDIYTARHQFSHDIAILTQEQISADFQKKVINAMNSSEFADLNARSACKYLETQIAAADLTKKQKDAWNNLLNTLGEKSETLRDVVIVVGMLMNQAMSNYHMPSIVTNNNSYYKAGE